MAQQLKLEVQKNILELAKFILSEHRSQTEMWSKMEAIDVAYARYVTNKDPNNGVVNGEGIDAATTPVGVFNAPSTTPPVVVSQVDSMVAYLAEVFLSGYPIFPVVSSPSNRGDAEALEALLDDHSTLGGYPRELLMFFRDCIKYNIGAVEADWTSVDQYQVMDDLLTEDQVSLQKKAVHFTKLKRLDPYNTIRDRNILPGECSKDGDYAGYIEILSKPKMKKYLNKISLSGGAMNVTKALEGYITSDAPNWRIHPQVSEYVAARRPTSSVDWNAFLGVKSEDTPRGLVGNYEKVTLYVRVSPGDLGMPGPKPNTPQIIKIVIVNGETLVLAERMTSAYDYLPILFGQPQEDGLGEQTQSIAESSIPIQQAAKTMFNISFNAARRAVSDRALYDSSKINPRDINAPVPAAKIPVRVNSLDGQGLDSAYKAIPFDSRGTENAMTYGMQIVGFGKDLSGLNGPQQGQFQKGNKSVKEWNDTMGGSDNRLRLPALTLEYQFFVPLKEMLKFNIYQYGEDAIVTSQKSGEELAVVISQLRKKVLKFRIADGYTPKSKLASTEMITQLMQLIMQAPILQQAYGASLPNMVAHLAQLGGIRGLDEYNPQVMQQALPSPSAIGQGPSGDPVQQNIENEQRARAQDLRQQANQIRARELEQGGL